jgi:hypothetical protein
MATGTKFTISDNMLQQFCYPGLEFSLPVRTAAATIAMESVIRKTSREIIRSKIDKIAENTLLGV